MKEGNFVFATQQKKGRNFPIDGSLACLQTGIWTYEKIAKPGTLDLIFTPIHMVWNFVKEVALKMQH